MEDLNKLNLIKPLHLSQSSGDLRKAYRVVLFSKVSAIDHKYLKYLPRIYINPKEKPVWRSLKKTFHRYHKTIINIKAFLTGTPNRFKFLRHFRNIRIMQVIDFQRDPANTLLLLITRRFRFLERIQSHCSYIRPKHVKRLPKLKILDLYYSRALNKAILSSIENLLDHNKTLKLNLLITLRNFSSDDEISDKILERVQKIMCNSFTNPWFTHFSPFYRSFQELVSTKLELDLDKSLNPEGLSIFPTLGKLKHLDLNFRFSRIEQWESACKSLKLPNLLEEFSLKLLTEWNYTDIPKKKIKLPVSGLTNLRSLSCLVSLGSPASPFIDSALELFKHTLKSLRKPQLSNLSLTVLPSPHQYMESAVVSDIMALILEFTGLRSLTLKIPYNPKRSKQKKLDLLNLEVIEMDLSILSTYINFRTLVTLSYDLSGIVDDPLKFHMDLIEITQRLINLREFRIFSPLYSFKDAISIIKEFACRSILLPKIVNLVMKFSQITVGDGDLRQFAEFLPYSLSLKRLDLRFQSRGIIRGSDSRYELFRKN